MDSPDLGGYITITEAARIAGISVSYARYLAIHDKVETFRTPLGRLVGEDSLRQWMRERLERRVLLAA